MFDRNIGVITQEQQSLIKSKTFAIIGCGGMGSAASMIVARTGIEGFILADPDKYEDVNINNQFHAYAHTMGRNKAEVTTEVVKTINPNVSVKTYPEGLTEENVENIVKDADIIFDCIDYNELFFSYLLAKHARNQGKYVLAPQAIGYGGSVVVFDPKGMSFNEHLGLDEGLKKEDFDSIIASPEKYASIIPKYIDKEIVKKTINREIPIPNIALAQTLAASIMVAEALFILLKLRKPTVAPKVIALDLLENKLVI